MVKKENVFNLKYWQVEPPEKYFNKSDYERRKEGEKGSLWLNDNSIKPLDLYCYLMARFGRPNGIMMLTRIDSTENLFHWHYTIKIEDSYLEIINSNHGTEFMLQSIPPFTNKDWQLLMKIIKDDFKHWGNQITDIRKKLEKWTLFINPFARIKRVIDNLYKELSEIKLTEPSTYPVLPTQKQYDKFQKEMELWRNNLHDSVILGLSLRMLAPIMGEAFINLLLFYFARSDIKQDQRIYDSILREDIDIRVRKLHLHCVGFLEPVDINNDNFKNFQTLMNNRNNLLHGNIDPRLLVFETVFLDSTIPIFSTEDILPVRLIRNFLCGITKEESLNDIKVVRAFIDHILSLIVEPYKKDFLSIMDEQQLGWYENKGEIGILFGKVIPLGVAITSENK